MEYVIGAILAIIIIMIIGLSLRKKMYRAIDEHEARKISLVNQNVAEELSKMKELNIEGDAKEKFERWKDAWEAILAEDVAAIEEQLEQTEKMTDQFNIPGAKKSLGEIAEGLDAAGEKVNVILTELHELLETETANRREIKQLEPMLLQLRKKLTQNHYLYQKAEARFDIDLDEIHNGFTAYEAMIEAGNYIQATEIVKLIKDRLTYLEEEIETYPALYKQCKHDLPSELDELYRGIMQMKEEGYLIDHLELEKEINVYQAQLLDMVLALEKTGNGPAKQRAAEIETRVQEMYQQLEKEAIDKNFVTSKLPNYERAFEKFEVQFIDTKKEVTRLKKAYYFEDSDLEKYMSLEKMVTQLQDQFMTLARKVEGNKEAHSKIRNELEEGFRQLQEIEVEHEDFRERIENLRKDEIEARDQLQQMNETIFKTNRKVRNSNLPGVPDYIWTMIEEASKKSDNVLRALDEQPLDILQVQKTLMDAQTAVTTAIENTNNMLEQADLTEQVIQYANRYRSADAELAEELDEAERFFRKAEYELALEKAAAALENVESGALEKIEQQHQETTTVS